MSWETRLATHIGIKQTFLQHGQYFTKLNDATESLTIDDLEVVVEYPKAKYYQHQKFASKLCDKNGQLLTKPLGISNSLKNIKRSHYHSAIALLRLFPINKFDVLYTEKTKLSYGKTTVKFMFNLLCTESNVALRGDGRCN